MAYFENVSGSYSNLTAVIRAYYAIFRAISACLALEFKAYKQNGETLFAEECRRRRFLCAMQNFEKSCKEVKK